MNNQVVELAPGIIILENFIENPEEVVSAAFKRAEAEGIEDASVVVGDGRGVNKQTRSTKVIDVSANFNSDVSWWLLAQKIWAFGDEYAKNYQISFSYMETLQFLHYPKGEGFYNIHADSAKAIPRIFSAVLYLNDVEKGGETYFNHFDISVTPKAGRLAMFPANYMYTHGAHIPESGDKNVIVTWFAP